MDCAIINSSKYKTTKWSGGQTTELYIFPPSANYQQIDFSFRISTATVEVEESVFTSLNGISRKLMILEGSTTISHEGHHSKKLSRFDVDEFEGDWRTTSRGKCTDFNLMTNDLTHGQLSSLIIKKMEDVNLKKEDIWNWLIIFVYSGKVGIYVNQNYQNLNQGDLLVLTSTHSENLKITGIENSELILSKLYEKESALLKK